MKKPFIKILIGLISAALIGLVVIQFYWIDNAVKLKQQRFKQAVNAALMNVVRELERKEALEEMNRNSGLRDFLSPKERVTHPSTDTSSSDRSDSWKITEKSSVDTSSSGVVSRSKIVTREYQGKGVPQGQDGMKSPFGERGSSFLQQIMDHFSFSNPFQDPRERIEKHYLDSLVKVELENRGISTDYQFGVFGDFGQPLFFKDEASKENFRKMNEPAFSIRLFPRDFFKNNHTLRLYFPDQTSFILRSMGWMLFASALMILIIIFAFSYTIFTILKQKKLSRIKNDFIGNMTHELKTPISTISLACQALDDPDVSKDNSSRENFVRMIGEENQRLGVLVENVLRSAILDRGEVKLKNTRIDLHELIDEAIRNISIQVEKKQGTITNELAATNHEIEGDKVHLTNLIFNLLDNAIKYSGEHPKIKVTTSDHGGNIRLAVGDNGPGIKKEEQKRIFDRLYRVPTGNIHDVKGSGLGLSYVKVIAEKHGGKVDVESEPGKGSTFIVLLPLPEGITSPNNQKNGE